MIMTYATATGFGFVALTFLSRILLGRATCEGGNAMLGALQVRRNRSARAGLTPIILTFADRLHHIHQTYHDTDELLQ